MDESVNLLQMLLEERVHVFGHIVEPGKLIPTAMFPIFVNFDIRPNTRCLKFLSGRLIPFRLIVFADHKQDGGIIGGDVSVGICELIMIPLALDGTNPLGRVSFISIIPSLLGDITG